MKAISDYQGKSEQRSGWQLLPEFAAPLRAMEEEAGWQKRLCMALCSPPIPRLQFLNRTPLAARDLPRIEKGAILLFVLGMTRGYLNAAGVLQDFMDGGTDTFAGMLAFLGTVNCCAMNGSLLISFLVWATVNAVLFDLFLNFGGNLAHASIYCDSPLRTKLFIADNAITLLNVALQLWLVVRVKAVLDDVLPGWLNMISHGSPRTVGVQQPLLARPGMSSSWAQPHPAGGTDSFKAFAGSGKRLGTSGTRTDDRTKRAEAAASAAQRRLDQLA